MFCTKCGSQIADGSKFCYVCGAKHDTVPENVQEQMAEAVQAQMVEPAMMAVNDINQVQAPDLDATVSMPGFAPKNDPMNGFNSNEFANDFNQASNVNFGAAAPMGEYGATNNDAFGKAMNVASFSQEPVQDFNSAPTFDNNIINFNGASVSDFGESTVSLMEFNQNQNVNDFFETEQQDDGENTQRLNLSSGNPWDVPDNGPIGNGMNDINGGAFQDIQIDNNSFDNNFDNGSIGGSFDIGVGIFSNSTPAETTISEPPKKKKGLPAGAIIGIIAGGLLILGGIGIGAYFVFSEIKSESTTQTADNNQTSDDQDENTGDDNGDVTGNITGEDDGNTTNPDGSDPDAESAPVDLNAVCAERIKEDGKEYINSISTCDKLVCGNSYIENNGNNTCTLVSTASDPMIWNIHDAIDLSPYVGGDIVIAVDYETDVISGLQLFYTTEPGQDWADATTLWVDNDYKGVAYFIITVTNYTQIRFDTPDMSKTTLKSFKIAPTNW